MHLYEFSNADNRLSCIEHQLLAKKLNTNAPDIYPRIKFSVLVFIKTEPYEKSASLVENGFCYVSLPRCFNVDVRRHDVSTLFLNN